MNAALFSYGTLMLAPVRRLHSRRALTTEPATLTGFRRAALRGASYPGLVPDARSAVTGVLVRGISPALLARLDRWEGAEYARAPVHVTLASGESVPALVYVLAPHARHRALAYDWDASAFVRRDLARWLKTARHRNAKESQRD